jgi:hypothetical protein
MEQSTGRATEPSTEADAPDAREIATTDFDAPELHTPAFDAEVRRRLRDVPPSLMREDTGIIDLDEVQRSIDPLDPRRPGRPTNDPLDPAGGVI